MSALPAAAGAIGSGFLASLGQLAVSPWALIPAAVAVLMLTGRWYLGRRSRITHLVFLPPEPAVFGSVQDALRADLLARACGPCNSVTDTRTCVCEGHCGRQGCQGGAQVIGIGARRG